jgi:hypothetical protein
MLEYFCALLQPSFDPVANTTVVDAIEENKEMLKNSL